MTVSNERKVAEIRQYILEEISVPVESVAEHLGISYGTAQDIMFNKLGMRRVSFAPVFQLYFFTPWGSPGVTIHICRVLISDLS